MPQCVGLCTEKSMPGLVKRNMAEYQIFADFGSTFTKLVAFDMEKEELAARVQAPSSVDTDIMIGLREAFDKLSAEIPVTADDMRRTVACSSAAGGLRMLCIGLVPDYTTKAGRLAALGAGAKVVGEYSFELTGFERQEILKTAPDIILLTGGTDRGNSKVILHNAKVLASMTEFGGYIVVAGNAAVTDEIREIFGADNPKVYYTENVMPKLGQLNLVPVNRAIREIFIRHITEAKGLSAANQALAGVVMPTPSAVFEAAKLLSLGVPGKSYGLGELLLVDVGGATTDVYSICDGRPKQDGVELCGMEEPFAKRTVEGDLGLFHNLENLAAFAEEEHITIRGELREAVDELLSTHSVPSEQRTVENQLAFSRLAVNVAVNRHAGTCITEMTPHGISFRQYGKDLSQVGTVIGAGGPVCFSSDPGYVLQGALASPEHPQILKPKAPKLMMDSRYILFAIGLLSRTQPEAALRIAKKYLVIL